MPGRTTPAEDSGTSFHAPGRSPSGSETTNRVSSPTLCRISHLGVQLTQRCHVGGEEQRATLAFAGVAEGPDGLAVAGGNGSLERILDAVIAANLSPRNRWHARQRRDGSSVRPNVSAKKNRVSESVDPSMSRYSDGSTAIMQVSFGVVEFADCAVVHPQPAIMAEWVAVGALHRRTGRRPDVGEQQRRTDLACNLPQVPVVPRRFDALEQGRLDASPYQPIPKPSPLVVVAPMREWRLWSMIEC